MRPRPISAPSGPRITTASPRLKAPSTRITPAGSRLLPRRSAATAPASTVRVPRGSSEPAIHFLRAVTGLAGVRNQVHGLPSAIDCSGLSIRPEAITMWVPAVVAILPASILVRMPPRESCEPASPAIASTSGVMRGTSAISLAFGWSPGGESVVVAVTDLAGRHRVVLVDHRHRAELQQFLDGRARVEITPPFLGVAQ